MQRHLESGLGWRGLRTSHFLQKEPSHGLSSRIPQLSPGQPLTLLITGLAADTSSLRVVFPGQEGALRTRNAGGVATGLCTVSLQVVPCETQSGICQRGLLRNTQPALHLSLLPLLSPASYFPPTLPGTLASPYPLPACLILTYPESALIPPLSLPPCGHLPTGQPLQQNWPYLFWESLAQSHLGPRVLPWPWTRSSRRRAWETGAADSHVVAP